MTMTEDLKGESRMLIDGELVEARSGNRFPNINPATEEIIGETADGGAHETGQAIAAARRAFDESDWSRNHDFRKRCIEQLREGLTQEKETLRKQVIAEVGAPLQLTYGPQCDSVINDLAWVTGMMENYSWEQDLGTHSFFGIKSDRQIWKEAVGVVAAITPWNYPLQIQLAKIAPALAAGCTVILKPSPETPWCGTFLGRVAKEHTDIPPGVFNVITSADPAEMGTLLAEDPRVDLVSFTGSTATGARILATAAPSIKKVFLELGGKSANIVLDDADFDRVIPAATMVCIHAGQGCAMQTRLLLPRSRYEEGVKKLITAFEGIKYGDPCDVQNSMGPLINAVQQNRVLRYIAQGKQEGATLAFGGGIPKHIDRGYFVEPTLFTNVDNKMAIAQEEIFGPVLCVIPYEDDEDAIRIANDSSYGLSGAIHSGSEQRALDMARRIRTGTMGINGGMWYAPDCPFGGYKKSGIGREMGVQGFEEYLETKVVGVPTPSTTQ